MEWLVLAEIASQIEQEERDELAAEASDLADAERATITLEDRLRGAIGTHIEVQLRGRTTWLGGRVEAVGQGWFLMAHGSYEWVAFTHAVISVRGASLAQMSEGMPVTAPALLRRLQGSFVEVFTDAGEVRGTIMEVAKDHIVLEPEVEARYGSHAEEWKALYDFGEKERLSQITIAINAIAAMRQARVNR